MKKASILIVLLLLCISTAYAEADPQIKKITFSEKSHSLAPGTYCQLDYTIQPENVASPSLQWSSSNEKVATVNEKGVVTAIEKGNAKITVSAADGSKAKATISIKVEEFDLVFVSIKPQDINYSYSGTGMLKVSASVKNGNVSVPQIAKEAFVSTSGGGPRESIKVTPVKPGTDVITLKINGKKKKFTAFIADYFAEFDTQYIPIIDTTPHVENGSFQDIIYGTPYSEIKEQLSQKFGNNYTINDCDYMFEIRYKNPQIKVAGHDVQSVILEFCYDEDERGYITKDEGKSCFYRGEYYFSTEPNDSIAENLHLKLNEIYGKSDEELHIPEDKQRLWGNTNYSWSENDVYINLRNSTSLTLSYLWGKGFSKRQTLMEINEYLLGLEEQKKRDAEQNQYSVSTDGL